MEEGCMTFVREKESDQYQQAYFPSKDVGFPVRALLRVNGFPSASR